MANMKLTVVTTTNNKDVSIALHGTLTGVGITWGDTQTSTPGSTPGVYTNQYATAGTYEIEISGTFTGYGWEEDWPSSDVVDSLTAVTDWGDNIANLTSLKAAFAGHTALTSVPDLPAGNIVTDMRTMFAGATSFNQDISTWTTSAVMKMDFMFAGATAFDQDISTWSTNAVKSMEGMFAEATSFNQPIGTWTTGAVTDMNSMFFGATAFDQDISTWTTSAVTNMYGMFTYATAFDQDISTWDTSAVMDMRYMFRDATTFNQPIGIWTTGAVTEMKGMFEGATAFDQDISGWDIEAVTTMEDMFTGATSFSTANYSATLIGWAAQTPQDNVVFSAGSTPYNSTAAAAHNHLTTTHGWAITDGGGESPVLLLCWQLTAEKTDGQIFQLNGDGPFPKVIDVPDTVILDTVLLIDEGIEIDKSEYQINVI